MSTELQMGTLRDWTGGEHSTETARFSSKTTWNSTRALLEREVAAAGGERPVLQIDVDPGDFRLDGDLRVRISDRTPRVRLLFDTDQGTLVFQAGQYKRWQDNARAIALTLEALRGVARWGAAQGGAQYKGYLELDAAGPELSGPEQYLVDQSDWPGRRTFDFSDPVTARKVFRSARWNSHPDRGGTAADFQRVQAAGEALGLT